MIVDEGGSGVDGSHFGRTFALPGVVEKGMINVRARVDMEGGHASRPTDHTTIGVLSEIVTTFEAANIFLPHLEDSSPIWSYLQCVARYGDESLVPVWIPEGVNQANPEFQGLADKFAALSRGHRYLIQTSKAATVFSAGVKVNATPDCMLHNVRSGC